MKRRPPITQPLDTSIRLVPLTQGQIAMVDARDHKRVSRYNWCAQWNPTTKTFYARGRVNGKITQMHQFILGECPEIDHRNHDTLDNRRQNIRPCTHAENMRNSRRPKDYQRGTILRRGQSWLGMWRQDINGTRKQVCRKLAEVSDRYSTIEDVRPLLDRILKNVIRYNTLQPASFS